MSDMRYLYANFTPNRCNYGNHIIDFATRHLLKGRFPDPAGELESWRPEIPSEPYDFVLLPGCTMLTWGDYAALTNMDRFECPAYCLAGSIWGPLPRPGWLIRTHIIGGNRASAPDLRIARRLTEPVGCRDRFSYEALQAAGIDARYTGCPTLMLPADDVADDGYVLMSLGRRYVRAQTHFGRRLARKHHVVGIVHGLQDVSRFLAAGWKLPLATYLGDIDLFLSYFKRARAIVTGRLHGALPGLAFGKPVFYYGTRDSRTTIFDDLGVPIHTYRQIPEAVERASPDYNRRVLDHFRENWDYIVQRIVDRHS